MVWVFGGDAQGVCVGVWGNALCSDSVVQSHNTECFFGSPLFPYIYAIDIHLMMHSALHMCSHTNTPSHTHLYTHQLPPPHTHMHTNTPLPPPPTQCYNVEVDSPLTTEEATTLLWLLRETFEPELLTPSSQLAAEQSTEVC